MARLENLAIFLGLLLAIAFVVVRTGGDGLNMAAAVFAMVAAWWGIALGLWSGTVDDDAIPD